MLENIEKVLIIKLRYIGDVLLITPVIRSVRENFSDAHISILVNKGTEDTLLYNPDVNEILLIDRKETKGGTILSRMRNQMRSALNIRSKKFDLVIDLTDGDRSAILSYLTGAGLRVGFNSENRMRGRLYNLVVRPEGVRHIVEYQLEAVKALGLRINKPELVLEIPEKYNSYVESILKEFDIGDGEPFVVIHPGARWWFKSWPLENFARLADGIQNGLGIRVILTGGTKEEDALKTIASEMKTKPLSLSGKTTILQLAALYRRAGLFVGNDNGPMHIAVATGTPVIALFGSSDPGVWGPWGDGEKIKVIYKGVDCSPCNHTGCDRGEKNCMRLITVEDVMESVKDIMNRN